ncbi:MAG: hypothetical protein WCL00_13665 [Bacteroidota bacterium]
MAKSTPKPVATSKPSKLSRPVKQDSRTAESELGKSEPVAESTGVVEDPNREIIVNSRYRSEADEKADISIERKLMALYRLQQIESQIDKIRIIRGELPLEVQDLEDEIAGLETRIENYIQETLGSEKLINDKRNSIRDSLALIKKYEEQQLNPRNIREFDSLSKEMEYQNLEIQLSEKRIREFQQTLDAVKEFNFSHVHTFKYSVRKGTRAERLENHIPEKIKNERSLKVRELSVENKNHYFTSFIGLTQDVLVEKISQGIASGYGQHYVPVRFKAARAQKNSVYTVKLTELRGTDENMYLFGELND